MNEPDLRTINRQRDEIKHSQRKGPDGLLYPILSLCCFYAKSEAVHRSCTQKLCACPCHGRMAQNASADSAETISQEKD